MTIYLHECPLGTVKPDPPIKYIPATNGCLCKTESKTKFWLNNSRIATKLGEYMYSRVEDQSVLISTSHIREGSKSCCLEEQFQPVHCMVTVWASGLYF